MKKNRRTRSAPVSEQAAEWYVELDDPTHSSDTRRRFFGWLKRSPEHIEEFMAVAALEQAVSDQSVTIDEILAEVRTAERQAVTLHPAGSGIGGFAAPRARRRRHRFRAAWAGVAGVAALAAFFASRLPEPQALPSTNHRTELGEQRSIALRDGSIVTLNTLSEVAVRFDDESRRVTLISGEVMFDVAHDAKRPFIVDAGAATVDVLGTKFSIYRKDESTQVAVIEGTVNARTSGDSGRHIELHGGEGAVFTPDGMIRRDETFDLERAVAWTERRLVFENAPLADVAREFNRYNRLQLHIEDPGLAERQITTVVNAHDVSALVAFLQLQPDVEVDYGTDTIRVRTGHGIP